MNDIIADRYELIERIGHGATGEVWRGTDTLLQREVAIKLVQLEGAKDPAIRERFRREGVVIAGLNHPGVVKVFDAGADEERGWLVMEMLHGPDLHTLVEHTGPLDYRIALPILAGVADGLAAAHQAGITHRDVKPANIMLHADEGTADLFSRPESGRATVIDFGIARIMDEATRELTRPATAIGTAAYMSPEQAMAKKVGSQSDIYSLGCVAFYVLSGRPPFLGDSAVAVARAQAFDPPPLLRDLAPGIPEALSALIDQILAKSPRARPDGRMVRDAFQAIAADPSLVIDTGSLEATRPTALAAMSTGDSTTMTDLAANPRPKYRPWLIGTFVVVLALIGLMAWSLTRKPANEEPTPTITMTQTTTATSSTSETRKTTSQTEPASQYTEEPRVNPTLVPLPTTTAPQPEPSITEPATSAPQPTNTAPEPSLEPSIPINPSASEA